MIRLDRIPQETLASLSFCLWKEPAISNLSIGCIDFLCLPLSVSFSFFFQHSAHPSNHFNFQYLSLVGFMYHFKFFLSKTEQEKRGERGKNKYSFSYVWYGSSVLQIRTKTPSCYKPST